MKKTATCAVTVFITADLVEENKKVTVDPTAAQIQWMGDIPDFADMTTDEKATVFRIMARIGLAACAKKLTAAEEDLDVPASKLTVLA